MARTTLARLSSILGTCGGVLLVAGCGPADLPPAGSSSTSPGSATTGTTSGNPGSTAAVPLTVVPAADDGRCKAGDVRLTLGPGGAAAGSVYRPLLITNTSAAPCTVQGFPGVSYVASDDGHQIGAAAQHYGAEGTTVALANGQTAAADIQFVNVQNYDKADCQPTAVRGLRIFLPHETASNFVPAPGTGCASTAIPGNQLSVKTVHRA